MSEVVTGSRLHFGLFQPGPPLPGQRRFGGAGMMIDNPGLHLRLEPAEAWSAEGPLAERTLAVARRVADSLASDRGLSLPPHRMTIMRASPEHTGLGTGTQLALAVARLLTHAAGLADVPVATLAALAGRGRRSAVGVYGFERGGFLVDAGQAEPNALGSLAARADVPAEWRAVVCQPQGDRDWHGQREQSAFEVLEPFAHVDRLCRLVLLGLLPALAERDVDAFGEALHELNALSGEAFAASQGGAYAGPRVTEIVQTIRAMGVSGVSQSSWGPAVFAVVGDADRARFVADRLRQQAEVLIAAPLNAGAVLL